jgi:hypothetical protein
VLRKDKVVDSKFKAHNSCISSIGVVQRRSGQKQMLTISNDGKISFWEGMDLIEQISLIDEEINQRLGTENLKIKVKAFAYSNGILVVGCDNNLILKINLDEESREVLIASHS